MLRQLARINGKLSNLPCSIIGKHSPLFSFCNVLYEGLKSLPHRTVNFRSSTLRYNSKDMSLLTYFYHPAIQTNLVVPNIQSTQFYHIQESWVLTLSFLQETMEGMQSIAWENRRTFPFTFRNILKLTKIVPQSRLSEAITENFKNSDNEVFTKTLTVTDSPQTQEILFSLQQKKPSGAVQSESSLSISYQDHPTFLQSIRNNTAYITGLKFQLELTKEQSLLGTKIASSSQSSQSRSPSSSSPSKKKKKQSP